MAEAGARRPFFRHDSYSSTDRKSTRLNSSHSQISYAVFCLKKKNKTLLEEGLRDSGGQFRKCLGERFYSRHQLSSFVVLLRAIVSCGLFPPRQHRVSHAQLA